MTQVLNQGYVEIVTSWGSDKQIIGAARMSTDKGFLGWGDGKVSCDRCKKTWEPNEVISVGSILDPIHHHRDCGGNIVQNTGDEKLLAYLYNNRHMTPFEMAGMILEVKAPIMVFREWHRHRTQSYNEMSARYVPLPDENYMPSRQRIVDGVARAAGNRQAQGAVALDIGQIDKWLEHLQAVYDHAQSVYEMGLNIGVPKELARLPVPVARYSRMRVSANLRNWLQFLELRDSQHAPNAQWEIQMYANAVGGFLQSQFPRTMALFKEES